MTAEEENSLGTNNGQGTGSQGSVSDSADLGRPYTGPGDPGTGMKTREDTGVHSAQERGVDMQPTSRPGVPAEGHEPRHITGWIAQDNVSAGDLGSNIDDVAHPSGPGPGAQPAYTPAHTSAHILDVWPMPERVTGTGGGSGGDPAGGPPTPGPPPGQEDGQYQHAGYAPGNGDYQPDGWRNAPEVPVMLAAEQGGPAALAPSLGPAAPAEDALGYLDEEELDYNSYLDPEQAAGQPSSPAGPPPQPQVGTTQPTQGASSPYQGGPGSYPGHGGPGYIVPLPQDPVAYDPGYNPGYNVGHDPGAGHSPVHASNGAPPPYGHAGAGAASAAATAGVQPPPYEAAPAYQVPPPYIYQPVYVEPVAPGAGIPGVDQSVPNPAHGGYSTGHMYGAYNRTRTGGAVPSVDLTSVLPKDGEIGVGVWGAPGSGKTTIAAALRLATLRMLQGIWRLNVEDEKYPGSEERMRSWIAALRGHVFPDATISYSTTGLILSGSVSLSKVQRMGLLTGKGSITLQNLLSAAPEPDPDAGLGRRVMDRVSVWMHDTIPVDIPLVIWDYPGGEFLVESNSSLQRLIPYLAFSQGLIYIVDPLAKNNAAYLDAALMSLYKRVKAEGNLTADGKLPHRISIVVSKLDHPRVYWPLKDGGYLTRTLKNGGMYVGDARAAFEQGICYEEDDIPALLRQYFRRSHVQYFFTSAVGYYVNPQTHMVDPARCANVSRRGDGTLIIPGPINPLNVLEPFLWACSGFIRDQIAAAVPPKK
jgi:hypothetical protein